MINNYSSEQSSCLLTSRIQRRWWFINWIWCFPLNTGKNFFIPPLSIHYTSQLQPPFVQVPQNIQSRLWLFLSTWRRNKMWTLLCFICFWVPEIKSFFFFCPVCGISDRMSSANFFFVFFLQNWQTEETLKLVFPLTLDLFCVFLFRVPHRKCSNSVSSCILDLPQCPQSFTAGSAHFSSILSLLHSSNR